MTLPFSLWMRKARKEVGMAMTVTAEE